MILLLSGPAAAGKTSICTLLTDNHGFVPIKSSLYLRSLIKAQGRDRTREDLQEIGDRLDVDTDFNWLVDDVAVPHIAKLPNQKFWFVDSVRKHEQVDRFAKAFPGKVFHCHITAPDKVLKMRFLNRNAANGNTLYEKNFEEHLKHPNEISARSLEKIATFVVDTSKEDVRSACDTIVEEVIRFCQGK